MSWVGDWRPPASVEAGAIELRRQSEGNADALTAAVDRSREHLRPWMPWAGDENPEAVSEFVRRSITAFDDGTEFSYAAFDADGDLVGTSGLHTRQGAGILEIGYWIDVDHTRRGYAKALTEALAEVAATCPGVRRIEIHCDEANAASNAVARSAGFTLDRVDDKPAVAPGETGRNCVYVRPVVALPPVD